MILAIIPNSSNAESLLNNLSEADFKLADVTVVMSDPKARSAIADDAGPFKGTSLKDLPGKLSKAGLTPQETQACITAIGKGQVLIAMNAPKGSEQAAAEMMHDQSATFVKVTPNQ